MQEQKVETARQSSMDKGAIKELLESDAFVNAMRQILGLEREEYNSCDLCQNTETEVRQLKAENFPNLENDQAVHYCPSCERVVKDPIRKKKWVEREHCVMTKEGVEMYISNVRGLADKIIFTSNFKSEEISRIMENFHKNLAEELYQEWNDYGLENAAMAKKIANITADLVWAGYNRSLGGQTLDAVSNMGDDRTLKKAESGERKKSWRDKIGFGGG